MAISICAMYPVKKYACDVGGDQCDDETNTFEIDTAVRQVVLRPTQLALSIAAAGTSTPPLSSSISSVTSSISPPSISASGASLATNSSNTYTVGALTGVGVGVGLPLLIGLMAALWLYRKERNRNLTLSRREPMVMPPSAYRTTYSYPRGMSNPTRPPYELDGPRTRDGPIHG
ncbi:hypothetical protein M501DRAFT_1017741 [Patellaria atrata CBS 101060]|uniref:Mid2 domain-containing protein n=1 Tax=Patellaria atrata CBS 101060 TaxID=1346257 RepID=A0A9P4VQ60_9PEZI|nr:hypothetical protein M501DRAFT_1017741 [Patellaria atrata CBS 101060]